MFIFFLRQKWYLRTSSVIVLIALSNALNAFENRSKAHPDTIVMSSIGWSPAMREYHKLVIRRVLDLSVDKYGAYSLDFATKTASVQRVRNEIAIGEHFQVDFSAMVLEDETVRAKTYQLRFPIFDQTLGLRQLIVRRDNLAKFNNPITLGEFKNLRAGQGKDWQDIGVYADAGIEVIESITYENLFPMLKQGRFDYFPLGIIEAESALNEKDTYHKDFAIVDNIYIYYAIPFYINVTKRYTTLVERITYGVKKFSESGELHEMFVSYFKDEFNSLTPDDATLFVLKNPEVSLEDNVTATARVIDNYFSKKTRVFYLDSQRFDSGKTIEAVQAEGELNISEVLWTDGQWSIHKKN